MLAVYKVAQGELPRACGTGMEVPPGLFGWWWFLYLVTTTEHNVMMTETVTCAKSVGKYCTEVLFSFGFY
jgi:hypothetical protein